MKINKINRSGKPAAPLLRRCPLSNFVCLPGLVFSLGNLLATVVTTVTGGPSQANRKFYGYVDGDTKELAQFHSPVGLALDSTGNFLLVADRDNNAIRLLDLAGNQTTSFSITDSNLLDHP